ncbi:MAG: helix-turn-helix domain-containing protein, partial [Lentisphaerae bacterium]|nr:helix-turn-helix domain-containing protein [Lentisphaerota bacterium]
LQNFRLAQAETLLRTTLLPLTEISDRCGFCDSNYFILCFRKRYKITPYRYRKLFLKPGTNA